MVLKQKVKGHIEELSHHIKGSFGVAGSRVSSRCASARHHCTYSLQISIASIFGTIFGRKRTGHNELLKRLFELGHSNEQVVNEILALLVGVTVEVSLGGC